MRKLLLIALCCILSINCYANPPIFQSDYKSAKEITASLDQDMILIFTASWCGQILIAHERIDDEVFSLEITRKAC